MSASVQKCPDCGHALSVGIQPEIHLLYLYCAWGPCNPLLLRNLVQPKIEPMPTKKKKRKRGYR